MSLAPLWTPSKERIESSQMYKFTMHMSDKFKLPDSKYSTLHKFSVNRPGIFWNEILSFFDIKYSGELEPACTDPSFSEYGWYPNISLNFAENLLAKGSDDSVAISSVFESGHKEELTYQQLRLEVSKLQNEISTLVKEDTVVACYMPNTSHTLISMLATAGLGGVFTSTSSDFGIEGVVDRFSQSNPEVLITSLGYEYNGKYFDQVEKIQEIQKRVPSIKKVILIDLHDKKPEYDISNSVLWSDLHACESELIFKSRKFNAPLYIMYSSGTTGKPKCIVHSVGGTLLQHVKELGLHTDLTDEKTIFYFTTCGWMMWNWLASSIFFGAKVVLYEGSPAYPTFTDFLRIIEREEINIFGTSPKFLRALEDSNTDIASINLDSLETLLSTGAPLLPDQYDYVYQNFKQDLLLASISGGTDILGCFFLGNPVTPVYKGELQCIGLGMAATCFNSKGEDIHGEEGELVCLKSFPSRPIYFLNDEGNERMYSVYFDKFPGVWHHGDFIKVTERGTVIVYGRSDATLNPGGVRIGTSEIYRQTEGLSYIEDAICVGKQNSGDVDIILYVTLHEGEELTTARIKEIKSLIRANTTPRHVPRRVIAVAGIPYTRSGKKMEMAVTRLVNGRELENVEAVANPECLNEYKV